MPNLTESDGFQTVTAMNSAERFKPEHGDAAFKAWAKLDGATFHLMLSYKLDDRKNLEAARDRLIEAVKVIDTALSDDAGKVAALQAARAERRGEA